MSAEVIESLPVPVVNSPLSLIEKAIDRGATADQIKMLVELYQDVQARQAERLFAEAMNTAQREMPRVVRWKPNQATGSRYAPLETVNETVMPIVTKHGFSPSFTEEECAKEGYVRIGCHLRHAAGHCQHHFLDGALDTVGPKGSTNKTAIQGKGSSITYLRRYLMCMIFNISIADEDTDGDAQQLGCTVEEIDQFTTHLNRVFPTPKGKAAALKFLGLDDPVHLTKIQLQKYMAQYGEK